MKAFLLISMHAYAEIYLCRKLIEKIMTEKEFSEKNYNPLKNRLSEHNFYRGACYKGKVPNFEISVQF
jgi:hypothetical protein